ncbi:fibronectin type III domain-containing protein [Sphingobium sp. AS12]|uniref:fibronectin type III domain-containing protein n=1 Tax=Sphingobium sp. AS12 TaxID=2849495 RepID=UPI001C318A55|nr:fibronectin type III domain-containing protein [Sphingobium sp. AS12]MBV2147878.1 fibronectin type III domain-containing protein [Sphingobium sp. AS12]
MPQALALAIVTAVGATGVAATLITVAVNIALALGLSLLTNLLFGPKRPKPTDGQQIIRQAVGSRKRHYGIVHSAGQLSFLESSGGRLGMTLTLGTGEEAEILQHRINDKAVTVSGGTVTQSSFRGAVHIYTRQGTDDQTAVSQLTARFPQWTSAHRQRGCALAVIICDPVKQKYFSEVYSGQMPAYSQVRKAVKLYDPRKDSTAGGSGAHRLNNKATWEWSDNGPLVIADYVAHPDGYGLGYDNINWANIAAEADIADQAVTTVTDETIARWRLWASYSLADDERRQILTDMMKAVDGFCWQGPDFKFNLMVGRFEEPDITITDDHIKAMTATLGPQAQQRVSALKMLYTEAAIGYREQESATIDDPDSPADPNTSPQAVQLYYAPHHNQAVRVGKINIARLGNRWHIEATLNLFGLNLLGRRFCRLDLAQLGVDAIFAIEGGVKLTIGPEETSVSVSLIEVRASDWDFDAATEEGVPPIAPDAGTETPIVIPEPTGLTLSAVPIALGESNGVAIEASWDAGDRDDLVYQVQYRPSSGGTWVMMTVDDDALTARSGVVDSGTEYEVQVRALTIGYRASLWSDSETITPSAAAMALSAPVFVELIPGTGEALIRLRLPTAPTLSFARLYHGDSEDFGDATQVGDDIVGGLGQVMDIEHTGLLSGAHYYWARAYETGGGWSALAGPEAVTID